MLTIVKVYNNVVLILAQFTKMYLYISCFGIQVVQMRIFIGCDLNAR